MKKWQAVFFDFDGVVLDSVQVKTEAFAQMFRSFGPDVEQAVVAYHLAHGGMSRFEKFRYYYNNLLHMPVSEDRLLALGEEFSDLVLTKILEAPFVAGASETLIKLAIERVPAFVVSGTPDVEVKFIVEKRKLIGYFQEVHGSPRYKDEILRDIIGRKGYEPEHCLFLGDAMTDYKAALVVGTRFLGVVPEGIPSPFPDGTDVSTVVCCNVDGSVLPIGCRQL
jgi:phosphoglycolate phosphatase-like HAD superfamily hydrolase